MASAGLPGLCDHYTEGTDGSVYSPGLGELPLTRIGLLYSTEGPTHGPSGNDRGTEPTKWLGDCQEAGARPAKAAALTDTLYDIDWTAGCVADTMPKPAPRVETER